MYLNFLFQLQKPKDFQTEATSEKNELDTAVSKHPEPPIPAMPSHTTDDDFVIQPPPFASPKPDSILETSDEHAVPYSVSPTGGEVKRDAARNILQTVLDTADGKRYGGSEEDLSVVGNDPLLNMEFMSGKDFSAPLAKSSSPDVVGSPSDSDKVSERVCECEHSRSALFNGDIEDEEDDDANYSKDVGHDRFKKCGRLKRKPNMFSSTEDLNSPPPDDTTSSETKAKYKQRTLSQSKRSESAANLHEKANKSVVKRKIMHKRSQSDVQLGREGVEGVVEGRLNKSADSSGLSSSLPADRKGRRNSFLENGK